MTGFAPFLRKELTEIRRTWRLWVIPGMLLFLGVTSPIIAAITPALVKSMTAAQRGMVVQLPPPTALDAFAQFIKNLDQFILIAIIIAGAGVVSGERSSGTATFVLTKPLSRGTFVVTKILSQFLLLVTATALGTAACVGVTSVIFTGVTIAPVLTMVALWLLYAAILVVVMTLFSAAFKSRGAAAGAGLGFYFFALLLSNWAPAARFSFFGLVPAMRDALIGHALSLGWPVATAVAAIVVGTGSAVRIFERQEL
ncbi:MAG TPA: ABC transporter permease [Gemmatimonadaceae bacterium]|jgi:ABC-2 type transport system permease protein